MDQQIKETLDTTFQMFDDVLDEHDFAPSTVEVGEVTYVGRGIARASGLPGVQAEELLHFPNRLLGLAFNLDADEIGVVLLDESEQLTAGRRSSADRTPARCSGG